MAKLPTNAPNVGSAKRLAKKPPLVGEGGRVKKSRASANAKPLREGEWLWDDGVVTDDYGNPIVGPVRDESGAIIGYTSRDGQTVVKEAYDMAVRGDSPNADMPDPVDASDPAALDIPIPEVVDGEVVIVAPDDPKVAASAPEADMAPNIQSLARKVNDLGGSILNRLDVDNQEFINQAADEIMRQFDASGNPSPQMQLLLADPVMKERLDAIVSRATDDAGSPPTPGLEDIDPYTGETADQRGMRRLADDEQKMSRQGAYAIPGNKRRRERLAELGLTAREAPLAQKPRYEARSPVQNDKGPVSQKKAGKESQRDTAAALARTAAGFGSDPRARASVAMGVEERAALGDAELTNPVVSTDTTAVAGSRQGSGLTSDLQREVGGGIDSPTPETAAAGIEDRRPQLQAIIDNLNDEIIDLQSRHARGEINEFYLQNETERLQGAQRVAAGMWLDLDTKLRAIVPDSGVSGTVPDASSVTLSGDELEDISVGNLSRNRGLRQKLSESRRAAALRELAQTARGTAMVPGKNSIVINDGENPVAFLPTQPDFLWEKVPVKDDNGEIVGSRWEPSWNARRGESALVQRPVQYDMPIEWFVGDGPGLVSADDFVQHIARLGGYHDVLMKSPLAQDAIRQMMDRYVLPDSPIYGNRDLFRSTGTGGPSMADWIPELGPVGADAMFDEIGRLRNPVPLIGDSADGPAPRFTAPGMRQPPSYDVDQLVSMREQLARQREALVKRAEEGGEDELIPRAASIQKQIRDIDARIRAATGGGPNTPSPTMELSPEQMNHFIDALADYNERWSAASDWMGRPTEPPLAGGRQTMGPFDAQSATDAARQAAPDFEDALPAEADRKALGGAGYSNLPYFPTATDIATRRQGSKRVASAPAVPTVVDGASEPVGSTRRLIAERNAKLSPPPGLPAGTAGKTPDAVPQFSDMEIDDELERHYRDWFASNFPKGSPAFPDFESWWAKSGATVRQDPAARSAAAARLGGSTPGAAAAPAGGATPAAPGATPAGPTPSPTPAAGGAGPGSPPPPSSLPATPAGATPAAPGSPAPGPTPGNAAANNLAQAWGAPQQGPPPPPTPRQRRLRDLVTLKNASLVGLGGAVLYPWLAGPGGPSVAEMAERAGDGAGPFGPPGGMPPGGVGVGHDGFSDPLANDRAFQMARALQMIQAARVPQYQTAQNPIGLTQYR